MLPNFLRPERLAYASVEIVRAPSPVKPRFTAAEVAAGLVLRGRGWSVARVRASLLAQRELLALLGGGR
jgi:hypothetical protein